MTDANKALLTFSIGPVHSFIAQARRIADVWAGSHLLSDLIARAITALQGAGGEMVFPSLPGTAAPPEGLPNRFVCRVALDQAPSVAASMDGAVRSRWRHLADEAKKHLAKHAIPVDDRFDSQMEELLDISWSFVPESPDYATASVEGARRFAASRLCRPFRHISERDTKCAVCGERTALPDGISTNIADRWKEAERRSGHTPLAGFFRYDQGRLCLVCATKRLYPLAAGEAKAAQFNSFHEFEPRRDDEKPAVPYFAVVTLDGDHMGRILGWDKTRLGGTDVEAFHRRVSEVLTRFAGSLRSSNPPELNLKAIGYALPKGRRTPPQLIYAGGEDVLLVCDARDAIPVAQCISATYRRSFADPVNGLGSMLSDTSAFTMSAAIIFAHSKEPAGALLHDVDTLLKEGAKRQMNRNALAIRLLKRGGPPVDVAFKWEPKPGEKVSIDQLLSIVRDLHDGRLGSTQLYGLADDFRKLDSLDLNANQWTEWLQMRLGRGEKSAREAESLAPRLSPFFEERRVGSLRIARFLGVEVK